MKNRLSRREFLKATSLVSAGAVLAACVPGEPGSGSAGAAADTASSDAPAAGRVQIDFMNWWGSHREALMDEVIANFHDMQDEVEVVNSVQPWDGRVERAATAIASSTPPALIMTQRVETYKFVNEDLIVPIDDYVAASGINPDEIFYASEINNQRWEGKLYSYPLPTGGGISGQYFWNKQVYADAGLDPEAAITTWQEMEDAAKAVTVKDDLGLTVNFTTMSPNVNNFVEWLHTNNGRLVNDDNKTIAFNGPEGVQTLEWMLNFTNEINGGVENGSEFYAGTSHTSADHPFYNETAATVFTGTWFFGHMSATDPDMWESTDNWGCGLRPYNGDNADATHHGAAGLSGSWGYVIPKNSPQELRDAAYKYLEFFGTHKDGGCLFLFNQSRPSAVIECNNNQAYFDANPAWDVVLDSLASDISIPVTPAQSEINDIISSSLEEAFFGVTSAEEALNNAAEKSQAILDEFWAG
ncbi:MAG: substrate-binding domain-containing protein [Chloroflexota bacterium]